MLHKTTEIVMDYDLLGIRHDDKKAVFTTYILESYPEVQGERKRPLVIVCPGGGYGHHSPREGEAVAIRLNSLGFNVCVLKYSLIPNQFPCALYEAACMVAYAREHSEEWSVDPDKIIIAGFSAGGHVAACLGTMWNDKIMEKLTSYLKCTPAYLKPNGMLLAYPVITSGEFAHRVSFEKLLGTEYDKYLEYVSLEKRVNADTPVTFLWHTYEDNSVPLENSLMFASALRKEKIHFELHVFPKGSHGIGLGTKETDMKDGSKYQPECECWIDMFQVWAEKNL